MTAEPIIPPGVATTREQYSAWQRNILVHKAEKSFDHEVANILADLSAGAISKHAAYRWLIEEADSLDGVLTENEVTR